MPKGSIDNRLSDSNLEEIEQYVTSGLRSITNSGKKENMPQIPEANEDRYILSESS